MSEDITILLNCTRDGDKNAESRLISLVYKELHHLAARAFQKENPGHTLQATALVNEAYIRLFTQPKKEWKDRAHFFGVASQVMRHVLVDHARSSLAVKRGGPLKPLPLDEAIIFSRERLEDLLIFEDALVKLEQHDARVGQVVMMKFYGGMAPEEIAEALNVSPRTVKRDWTYGRAWLRAGLERATGHDPEEQLQS